MYVPSTRKIILSYYVVFDESFSGMLAYTSQPYAEEMSMCPAVSFIPFATSLRGNTINIITFAQFEEGGLLYETGDDAESSDKCDDDFIMPLFISGEEMDAMDYGYQSDDKAMSLEILEDISDRIKYHPCLNRR